MRQILCWLFSLTFLLPLSAPAAEPGVKRTTLVSSAPVATPYLAGQYRALVIGNDDYDDPERLWPSLKTADADAVWAETSAPTAEVRKIILEKDCQSCHVIPGIPEAMGKIGPPLTDFSKRRRIAGGKLKNTPKNLRKWLADPRQVKTTVMPNSGLTQKEIDLLIAFLSTL
jgi:cytochrome c2